MTTVHAKPVSRPVLLTPNSLLLAAATLGTAAALDGRRVVALTVFAAVLLWGLHEVRSTSARHRLRGHASTLVALAAVITMSMPELLSPPLDQLLVLSFSALPLLWVWLTAPTVRQVLRLRRPTGLDVTLLVVGFVGGLAVATQVVGNQQAADPADLAAVAALVVAVPVFDEAVYRGLLMAAVGVSTPAVLGVALVQGLAVAPAFGLRGLLVATTLGIVLGFVRQGTGRWQSSLSAHWGLALGIAAPLLTVVRVVS